MSNNFSLAKLSRLFKAANNRLIISIDAQGNPVASRGGAVGGASDTVFFEHSRVVTTAYTISADQNALCAGPITFNAMVTVLEGSRLTIV